MAPPDELRGDLVEAVAALGPALLQTLHALEKAARFLHPPLLHGLRRALEPLAPELDASTERFDEVAFADPSSFVAKPLSEAAQHARAALHAFLDSRPGPEATARVLGALRAHCRAQAALYPLHAALPPVSRYFLEPALWPRAAELDPDPPKLERVGVHDAHERPGARGAFSFYAPEWLDSSRLRPLVVALHGGSGHGADFLWTWLREARSRGLLLLAPTSQGPTWSLHGADVDAGPLDAMIDFVSRRWPVDPARILVTGLSDGATYSLLYGLRASAPCSAIAPVSGVLHPQNFANGNMERARGRRVFLAHGRLDWLFPVGLARAAAEELERAGADLVYREVDDLSHTYPREINDEILRWFDPALALPADAAR